MTAFTDRTMSALGFRSNVPGMSAPIAQRRSAVGVIDEAAVASTVAAAQAHPAPRQDGSVSWDVIAAKLNAELGHGASVIGTYADEARAQHPGAASWGAVAEKLNAELGLGDVR